MGSVVMGYQLNIEGTRTVEAQGIGHKAQGIY
jgi:hypothetical protein